MKDSIFAAALDLAAEEFERHAESTHMAMPEVRREALSKALHCFVAGAQALGWKPAMWHGPIQEGEHQVPKDGRMYPCLSPADRGFAWWDAERQRYGWVAEGDTMEPENITHWCDFPAWLEDAQSGADMVEQEAARLIAETMMAQAIYKTLSAGSIRPLPFNKLPPAVRENWLEAARAANRAQDPRYIRSMVTIMDARVKADGPQAKRKEK